MNKLERDVKDFFEKQLNILLTEEKLKEITEVLEVQLKKNDFVLTNEEHRKLLEISTEYNNVFKNIDFNDEIENIVLLDEAEELIDIEVDSDDSLFYCEDILTHNSAYGNVDVGMESVSDSIGISQTADTLLAIIATEEMRNENKVMLKFLKNRLSGFLGSIMLSSDYEHMRYTDFEEGNDSDSYNITKGNSINKKEDLDLGDFDFDFDMD